MGVAVVERDSQADYVWDHELIAEGVQARLYRIGSGDSCFGEDTGAEKLLLKTPNYPSDGGLTLEQAHKIITTICGGTNNDYPINGYAIPTELICNLDSPYGRMREAAESACNSDLRLKSILTELGTYAHILKNCAHEISTRLPNVYGLMFIYDDTLDKYLPGIVMEDLGGEHVRSDVWASELYPINREGLMQVVERQLEFYRFTQDFSNIYKALWACGVWHLDYKPANLMQGSGGTKLFDFGTAAINGELVPDNLSVSLNNAPPEQAWLYAIANYISDDALLHYYASPDSASLQELERFNPKIEVFQIAMMFWQLVFDDIDPVHGTTRHPRSSLVVLADDPESGDAFKLNHLHYFDPANYVLIDKDGNVAENLQEGILEIATQRTGLTRNDLYDLLRVLQKGMAFSPDDRHENARELLQDLQGVFSQLAKALRFDLPS